MSDIAIKVEGLGKKYKIGSRKSGEFRESFGNFWDKMKNSFVTKKESSSHHELRATSYELSTPQLTNSPTPQPTEFWALKDINFEIKQGEAVGIIGRNGAGKSTLLKILSRITKPTTGRFEINGRVSSLLEVGTGFHKELTGRENIYLNGTILGMKRREIKQKFDEIVDFSGVEQFIDTPVKHYSSGMLVRLAFSVAAHLEPEILIIDEVLAVGDAEFQKKCLGKMEDVTGQGRTVLFVSHNLGAVESLCSLGLLMEKGRLKTKGDVQDIVTGYVKDFSTSATYEALRNFKDNFIQKVELLNKHNQSCSIFHSNEPVRIKIFSVINKDMENTGYSIAIRDSRGQKLSTTIKIFKQIPQGESIHVLQINKNNFMGGDFSCDVVLFLDSGQVFDDVHSVCPFSIIDSDPALIKFQGKDIGSLKLDSQWL